MKNQLIKWQFMIDRMPMQKRAILVGTTFVVVLAIWVLGFYLPQKYKLQRIQKETVEQITQATELNTKRQVIENLAKDDTVAKLMNKYERLKEEMRKLDTRISQYEHRFIGEKELAQLLYSMLEQTNEVSILDFSNVDYLKDKPEQTLETKTKVTSAATPETKSEQKDKEKQKKEKSQEAPPSLATTENLIQLPSTRTQYKLVLKGQYFPILNYLKRVEALPWQLYWDKMDYQVETYPEAIATIEFYTLMPSKTDRSTMKPGASK
ncbi:hypothetical protein [Legionella impletisoli]|uniref:Uncharacterized protein n=1 Tax=Legionella impletisoli TaxID=343510 RepID=A0A917JSV2_9GAMM|nr:hypothetical protein [Legionella impletisoli]GGI85126.1 hypothetical protein GCM10007966_12140 [Legionella impletisoli]